MADGPTIEMEFSGVGGGWTDVSADIVQDPPVQCTYGILGSGPHDRVATTGGLSFALKNGPTNSAATRGYYSLDHASKRSGFDLGIRVRFSYIIGATTYYKFVGRLQSVVPSPGTYWRNVSVCAVVDWIDEAARYRLATLAMQSNKRADELIALVAAATPVAPISQDLDTGTETYVLSLDEATSALTELQKIAMSEYGYIYLKGDTSAGEVLRFEARGSRLTVGSPAATLTDAELSLLPVGYDRERIRNRVDAKTHPRTEDAAATSVLFDLQSTPLIPAGQTVYLNGGYTDPNQRAIRVTGRDMVAPVATTDYTMNTASDGSGTNLTASFTVTAAYTGSTVFYTITNGSASDGYITKLQARGRGVYDFEPVESRATDSASVTDYGERQVAIDMPYQSDAAIGEAVAKFVRDHYSRPLGSSSLRAGFVAHAADAAMLLQAVAREPGDLVSVTETVTGIDHDFHINGVALEIVPGGMVRAAWELSRAEPRGYWNIEIPGYSELDVTTVLAPL